MHTQQRFSSIFSFCRIFPVFFCVVLLGLGYGARADAATYYVDPSAQTNGAGTIDSPYNTFSGLVLASGNTYALKRGTVLKEQIKPVGASGNNVIITDYGTGALPVIDGENTRSVLMDLNTRSGYDISNLRFINQQVETGAAVYVSSNGNNIHNLEFFNCSTPIAISGHSNNQIYDNIIDAGNSLNPSIAYGIRIFGGGSANSLFRNTILSSAAMTYGTGILLENTTSNKVYSNRIYPNNFDGILMISGADSNHIYGNLLVGDLKDCFAIEGANSNFILNNTIIQSGAHGASYPALKIGNDFGVAQPASLNTIANNIIVSYSGIPYNNDGGGQNNISLNNLILNFGTNPIIRYDYYGGPTGNYLTLSQWQALGNDLHGLNTDPKLDANFVPLPDSPCIGAGTFVESGLVDYNGHAFNTLPTIGAIEAVLPFDAIPPNAPANLFAS